MHGFLFQRLLSRSVHTLFGFVAIFTLAACEKVERGEYTLSLQDPLVAYDFRDSPRNSEILEALNDDNQNNRQNNDTPPRGKTTGYDPTKDIARNINSQTDTSKEFQKIWLPPRLIDTPSETIWPTQRLPGNVLLKVEISTYPKIDCDAPDDRLNQKSRPYLESISPEALSAYGQPVSIKNIWIVPVNTDSQSIFQLGPLWLGNALRLAGGQPVFFDASQNCQADIEDPDDILPSQIFIEPPLFHVNARSPFTAKVLEVCPITSSIVKYEHRTPRSFAYYQNTERKISTATLQAQCSSGEQTFTSSPITLYFLQ